MVKKNKRSQKKTSLFKLTLVGFFSAFLLLAVFAAWFMLKNPKAEQWLANRHSAKVPVAAKKTATPPVDSSTATQEPQFEFYTMLPKMEVSVPDGSQPKNSSASPAPGKVAPKPTANPTPKTAQAVDKEPSKSMVQIPEPLSATKSAPMIQIPEPLSTPKSTPSTQTHMTYLLQAASFQEGKDARRVQIHLSKLGFPAEIETVMIKGVAWHRVYVGPFTTLKAVQTARQQLAAKGISTVFVANDVSDDTSNSNKP